MAYLWIIVLLVLGFLNVLYADGFDLNMGVGILCLLCGAYELSRFFRPL